MASKSQTTKKLKKDVKDLKENTKTKTKKVNKTKKQQIDKLVDKTEEGINMTIDKINETEKTKSNSKEFDEFLEQILSKAQEAVDYTKAKIEEIIHEDTVEDLDGLLDAMGRKIDELKETEAYKSTVNLFKDLSNEVIDYVNSDEVKQKIRNVKLTTLDYAQKGVDKLAKALNEDNTVKDVLRKLIRT